MIVTCFAAARSRAATTSPRSISRRVARATIKGLPWYLRRTPSGGVTVLTPSCRYQASAHIVNGANHQGPVMAAHMVGGQPGSVAKAPSHGYSKTTLGPRRTTERRYQGSCAARTLRPLIASGFYGGGLPRSRCFRGLLVSLGRREPVAGGDSECVQECPVRCRRAGQAGTCPRSTFGRCQTVGLAAESPGPHRGAGCSLAFLSNGEQGTCVLVEAGPGGGCADLGVVDVIDRAQECVPVLVGEVGSEEEPVGAE